MSTLEAFSARLRDPGDIAAADAFCSRLVFDRRGDFNVARRFAVPGLYAHLAALYSFARIARDIVEEPEHEGFRRERLDAWRRQLRGDSSEAGVHPAIAAVLRTREIGRASCRERVS
jgi:phytoene/squalene synthetase